MLHNEFDSETPYTIVKNGLVSGLYARLLDLQVTYQKADNYLAGIHDLSFASEKYTNAFGRLFRAFADNYMPRIINSLSDYLQLGGWETPNPDKQTDLDMAWRRQNLETQSGQVHSSAFTYGDAYVIVAPDSKGNERLYKQNSRQVQVLYDVEEPDRIILAIKLWQRLDGTWRLNVYVPGQIFRLSAKVKAGTTPAIGKFGPVGEADGDAVESPKSDKVLPVFHFANGDNGSGTGRGEMMPLYPVQDALNKTVCDMLVTMEYQAYRQRWATGIEIRIDDDGKPIPPMVAAVDRLVVSGNAEAKFGEFGQVDLAQFLSVGEGFRQEIARLATVPTHHLLMTGAMPSGEALKTAENPLLNKVRDRQLSWGNVWQAIGYYILGEQEQDAEDLEDEIDPLWIDVSPRSDAEQAAAELSKVNTAVVKINMGIPPAVAFKEVGYTDEEIQKFADMDNTTVAALGERLVNYLKQRGVPEIITNATANPAAVGMLNPAPAPVAPGSPADPGHAAAAAATDKVFGGRGNPAGNAPAGNKSPIPNGPTAKGSTQALTPQPRTGGRPLINPRRVTAGDVKRGRAARTPKT